MANSDEQDLTPQIKIHYENETQTLNLFLELENAFREYYDFYVCEIRAQRAIINRMSLLTQRYLMLIGTGPCCKYPEVYTLSAEEIIINEYEEKLQTIRASNNNMKNSILTIYQQCKQFFNAFDNLDMSMETPFIMGDDFHKPIKFYKKLVYDIFQYFYASVLKKKALMHAFDPINLKSMEDYKPLLEESEEFEEYLMSSLVYCHCLEPQTECNDEKIVCPKLRVLDT